MVIFKKFVLFKTCAKLNFNIVFCQVNPENNQGMKDY